MPVQPINRNQECLACFLKKGVTIQEADARAMLEIIERGIERSDKIINDLLDYAREIHLELQVHPVHEILMDALALVGVPEKVNIVNSFPDGINVRMDKNKMERVFINLINNGVDAMQKRGTMTISCKQINSRVEISFADTGVGIPEEIRSKLFSQWVTTNARFGLAICKRTSSRRMGGR